jgi:hypothetical protein
LPAPRLQEERRLDDAGRVPGGLTRLEPALLDLENERMMWSSAARAPQVGENPPGQAAPVDGTFPGRPAPNSSAARAPAAPAGRGEYPVRVERRIRARRTAPRCSFGRDPAPQPDPEDSREAAGRATSAPAEVDRVGEEHRDRQECLGRV